MNILLWTLQFLLALHTAIGAFWKFSHSAEQTMPSLAAIPPNIWMAMAVLELTCSAALILPVVHRRFANFAPMAAALIAVEMFAFCVVHMQSGDPNKGPMGYWLVVAGVCAFIAYGRLKLAPLK